jgi:hypothetical protein
VIRQFVGRLQLFLNLPKVLREPRLPGIELASAAIRRITLMPFLSRVIADR